MTTKRQLDPKHPISLPTVIEEPKDKVARPSYSKEVGKEICDLIAEGLTLDQTAAKLRVTARCILRWIGADEELGHEYAQARARQGDAYADRIATVVDRVGDPDTPEHLKLDANQARVMIDGLKWAAAKRAPKKYGDRITQEVVGKDGAPLAAPPSSLDTARWIADLLLTAETDKAKGDSGTD